jgi:hypothetical protein
MYHSKILNQIKLHYFLKFVVHKLNSKMVMSGIMVLIEREKADVVVGYKLQLAAGIVVNEGERKS